MAARYIEPIFSLSSIHLFAYIRSHWCHIDDPNQLPHELRVFPKPCITDLLFNLFTPPSVGLSNHSGRV